MNTLSFLALSGNSICCWQTLADSLPGLCWGIIGLVALFFVVRYVISPLIANCHERQTKKDSFEQEKFWHFQKGLEKDFKKELEDRIADLNQEKKELSDRLEKEKKERSEKLQEERLKAEHEFYTKIVESFYSPKKTEND